MTLLADWFFTTAMRLAPADAHAFLDTMATLRRRNAEVAELRDAVLALRTAPPWIQAYGLRTLLSALGSAGVGESGAPSAREVRRHTEELITSVLSLTEHPLAARLHEVLVAIVRGRNVRKTALEELATPLAAERRAPGGSAVTPYHELSEHIMPTLTVVALAELSRRHPSAGNRDWLGDAAVPLAEAALRGEFGRLALLAAAEGACWADPHARDVIWRILWRAGRGAAHLQPDLLDALARSWYGDARSEDPPTVKTLEEEAVTGTDLALWQVQEGIDRTVSAGFARLLTGWGDRPSAALPAVLWQATLWSLAAEVDKRATIACLHRWWQIPEPPGGGARPVVHAGELAVEAQPHVAALASLRSFSVATEVDDRPVAETAPADGSVVFSPWLRRWHDGWDHRRLGSPAFQGRSAESIIRLLASADLAVSLLRDDGNHDDVVTGEAADRDHLIALLFHTSDVLRDDTQVLELLQRGDHVDDHPFGPAVVSLLWHGQQLILNAGTGWIDALEPAVFADFALQTFDDDDVHDADLHEQLAWLARQGVSAICTIWITRAWVDSGGSHEATGPSRWFTGDSPLAMQVLFAGLDRLALVYLHWRELKRRETRRRARIDRDFASQNPNAGKRKPPYGTSLDRGLRQPDLMTAAQLLREIYPADWPAEPQQRWGKPLDIDWYRGRENLNQAYLGLLKQAGGDRDAVEGNAARPDRLLLSPRHPLELWRAHAEDLDNWSRVQAAPITMRALRLSAMLGEPAATSTDPLYREWVEEWLDRVCALDDTEKLPLTVRTMLIGLIEPAPPESIPAAHRQQLADIHAATVDAVLEFSGGKLRQVELLLERLATRLPLGDEGTDRLRLRAWETMFRRRRFPVTREGLIGASDVAQRRRARRHLEQAWYRFLVATARTAGQPQPVEVVPLAERIRQVWTENLLSAETGAVPIPLPERRKAIRDGEGQADELRTVASVLDRYRAREVRYQVDVAVDADGRHGQLHNLFQDPVPRQAPDSRTIAVVAIVTAIETEEQDGENRAPRRTVWLNCGTGEPLPYELRPLAEAPAEHSLVGARIGGRPVTVRELRRLDRAEPVPDEVRHATVVCVAPWLRVRVAGVDHDVYPHDDSELAELVRRKWDPDLARGFRGDTDPEPYSVLVRWDGVSRHWSPVTRRFGELIVDELSTASSVVLTHTSPGTAAGPAWLFVSSPGRLYHLPSDVWDAPGLDELLRATGQGLTLTATLTDDERPRLTVSATAGVPGHDDRNVRWLRQFHDHEGELMVATRDDRGRMIIEVAPTPGFPSVVAASGAGGGSRVHVTTRPWSDGQARRAEVTVEPVSARGVSKPASPTLARFAELHDVRMGDLVTLERMLTKGFRQRLVTTSIALVANLETESLTLLDPQRLSPQAREFVRGRVARVVNDPRLEFQAGKPGLTLSIAELAKRVHTAGVDEDGVREELAAATELDGVVVLRLADGKHYGTWCRFGASVHYVELAPEHFDATDPKLVGQPFRGTRSAAGWVLRFAHRRVVVRALFELQDAGSEPHPDAEYVGSDAEFDYEQLAGAPVLLRRRVEAVAEDTVRRLGLRDPDVELVSRYPAPTRTIKVTDGNVGDDPQLLLGATRDPGLVTGAVVVGAELQVRTRAGASANGLPYVEARRMFALRSGLAGSRTEQELDHHKEWREFWHSGKDHVGGALNADDTAVTVAGGRLIPSPDGVLRSKVPLAPEQEPAVAGTRYRRGDVWVRLVPSGDGVVASYRTAAPLSVLDYMQRQGQVTDGVRRPLREPLYYVGPPTADLDAHVFEWGYGWTVAVPPAQLRLPSSENAELPMLFHGDRIEGLSFVPLAHTDGSDGEAAGAPVMVVDQRDIVQGYVRRFVERTSKHLHLVELEIRVNEGTVRVLRAQASRSLRDTRNPSEVAQWVPFTAVLDDRSRDALVDSLRAAGHTGLVTRRVLARLDCAAATDSGGRERVFRAIRFGGEGLEKDDFAFLTAQKIERTDNELTVYFGLPRTLNEDDVTVKVHRREFSFRESTLARLVDNGLDVESSEVVMLVKILAVRRDNCVGSVRQVPPRTPETLVSYLARRNGSCYAIMGDRQLEIAPGVLFDTAETYATEQVRSGAVIRLVLDSDRRVRIETALPADESYLMGRRFAIVFPKRPLLISKPPVDDESMARMFTVAGLPDVQVSPVNGDGRTLIGIPHPKVCQIARPGSRRYVARPVDGPTARFARVDRRDISAPAGLRLWQSPAERKERPNSAEVDVPWARLSFADTSARDISMNCDRYQWQHHDRRTGHTRNGKLVGPYEVRLASAANEGVFFDDDEGWTLRYTPGRLESHGLPAGSLVDDRMAWTGDRGTFTVAGPNASNTGVWLELAPGRVVEVRGALITTEDRTSLADLDWSMFAAGDRIGLRLSRAAAQDAWEVGPNHLVLISWLPTVRGGLPQDDRQARILLPVAGSDRQAGALFLSAGRRLVYPMDRLALDACGTLPAVWLDQRNDVAPASYDTVRPGDIALVGVDEEGELRLAGLPDVPVRLAGRSEAGWPGYPWLRELLDRAETRRAVLAGLRGLLPVTVDMIGLSQPGVTVSRRSQRPGRWPTGRIVRTEVTASIGREKLLLRSGDALYCARVGEIVTGVPSALRPDVAKALAEASAHRPVVVWWRVSPDGIPQASFSLTENADPVVVAEYVVPDDDGHAIGVVCRDVQTGRHRWLAAGHASWIAQLPAEDLLDNLKSLGRLVTRSLRSGAVSVTTHPAVAQQAKRLRPGAPLRVLVASGTPAEAPSGRWCYVARLEVPSVLLSYETDNPSLAVGTNRFTEVDEFTVTDGRPAVTVLDINTRLVRLALPSWLLEAHTAVQVEQTGSALATARFDHYAKWYRAGLAGDELPDDPNEALVRTAGTIIEGGVQFSADIATQALCGWLSVNGMAAANIEPDCELDAAVLLSAVVTMAHLGRTDEQLATGAVALLHQVGRRAVASVHTEQFATAWINSPDRHHLDGTWARLRSLSLARDLTPRQVRRLRAFCRATLTKPPLRVGELALAPVARALLAAIGELDSATKIVHDAEVVSSLASWGRTLTAPRGCGVAQKSLLDVQVANLHTQVDRVIGDRIPITLLPTATPPFPAESRLLEETIRRQPYDN